ncbi:hypothetical protein M413DRAFT_84246 [Hebeloma cylindrosporum]|uniref:phytol kinase n=1 Tax=Hebeloma cylindrosporum TaxID=76867 RepID=A0A0C3CJ36_HEBCY|nr:hypothetical protein M413DRAFT_84246 [Hebeloma cylindrosporum h7]
MNANALQRDVIYNKFAALHLPTLVDHFLEPPSLPPTFPQDMVDDFKVNNTYIEMIGAISHTPYFAKYFRSQLPSAEGGKRLLRVLAQRLVELGPSWDRKMLNPPMGREPGYYESAAGTAIQLLSTLLAAFIKEPKESPILLSKETKVALLPWLKKWEKRYLGKEFLGMVCNRTRNQLEGNAEMKKDAQDVRRALKNWMVCGKPGCESTSSLKACGRCQTVRYCCPEHQKAHWAFPREPHKMFCFKAEY